MYGQAKDSNLTSSYDVPKNYQADRQRNAERLGHAGLIPFVCLAAAQLMVAPERVESVQVALHIYSVVIMNFVAGSLWSQSLQHAARRHDTTVQTFSILLSLLSWLTFLIDVHMGLLVMAVAFGVLRLFEREFSHAWRVPRWYEQLRDRLTVVVACSLILVVVTL
ncbi:DUF3429 domain-containing protein [Echinimonas agarilytica]|uniref:DUF3429 domain-containing protein n=1 Tax=Echinimonas agarilytica TaxID=1215918 RepID=A0AA42B8H9_9GAMM|nr:DUF3429 domain-containing protein [Echinimonas agarilytica]